MSKIQQSEFNEDYFYCCPFCDREHTLNISKIQEINYNTKNGDSVEKNVRCEFCQKDFVIKIKIRVQWFIDWIESTFKEEK